MTSSCSTHLVGSISLPDAATVFTTVAEHLGTGVRRIPDGEVGERYYWIQFQTFRFDATPGLARVGEPGHYIRDQFDTRPFVLEAETVELVDLGYADAALASYRDFARLKGEGVIPAGVRFQVSLPTPAGVVGAFLVPESRAAFEPIYEAALLAELDRIVHGIPHGELAVQWDTAVEFGFLEGAQVTGFPLRAWWGEEYDEVLEGVIERLDRLAAAVPADVQVGYHLCYGDVEEAHFIQPRDAGVLADVATGVLRRAPRHIDWVHLPVPIGRNDEEYFAPLGSVPWHDTEVYLGLVHHEDGLEGAVARASAARPFVAEFGVATECGFGRGPAERTVPLLELHAQVAAAL
jgi:hypothetical protein